MKWSSFVRHWLAFLLDYLGKPELIPVSVAIGGRLARLLRVEFQNMLAYIIDAIVNGFA